MRLLRVGVVLLGLVVAFATFSEPARAAEQSARDTTKEIQATLADLGFYRGTIDGSYGARTRAAVIAFHKAIGTSRTWHWQPADFYLAENWLGPDLPDRPEEPDRLEVDLARQVLYVIKQNEVTAVLPISSGTGRTYKDPGGGFARATTPRGDFHITRHINGMRKSPLGYLYRPWYFYGGYAIHGSSSVPAYPASHGCVRVPNWDADWLASQLRVGMPVHVWDSPSPYSVHIERVVRAPGKILATGSRIA